MGITGDFMTKIFLFDFDGTLVTEDILDVVCDIVGKKEESIELKNKVLYGHVKGYGPLCTRINFLRGVTYQQIKDKLDENNYLRDGVVELFKTLHNKGYITVVSSGNLELVLKYYQELLNITYVFGSKPNMDGDKIINILESNFSSHDFKYDACFDVIHRYDNEEKLVYGLGDSAADISMLSLADVKFAIDPKGGLENHVDYVVHNVREIIDYLD